MHDTRSIRPPGEGHIFRSLAVVSVIVLAGAFLSVPGEVSAENKKVIDADAPKVVLITIDGLRWQELFGGADESLMNTKWGSIRDLPAVRDRFWRDDAVTRRVQLMPFFWKQVTDRGIVVGDPASSPPVNVENGLYFSYPGYNELLTGYPDARVNSNKKIPNPNQTVLEWIHNKADYKGKVAVFGSWDVFPYIVNQERSGLHVDAGWDSSARLSKGPEAKELVEAMYAELPRVWHNVRYDYLTYIAAVDYIRSRQPMVLYISFGETDDWAHEGRYDLYLDAAQRTDAYIRRIWEMLESDPFYSGKTTLLITTDHGRGDSLTGWKDHGKNLPEAQQIWAAGWGPAVDNEVIPDDPMTQGQIAASVAAALNLDYVQGQPKAAQPFPFIRISKPH